MKVLILFSTMLETTEEVAKRIQKKSNGISGISLKMAQRWKGKLCQFFTLE